MKLLSQITCFCLLVLLFSCDPDESFDNENPDAKIEGEWEVKSVESKSYSSTMTSPSGQSDTSNGSFIGSDINMSLNFNTDNTFTTSGDYNQVLTIESPLPDPIEIEDRYNEFEGGGEWEIESDVMRIKTVSDTDFQNASLITFTDLELEFDYKYTRTIVEGTITRLIDAEVTFVLEKK